jgi:hypothetical protein
MNDFDVVTGPSPGSVAAKVAPAVVPVRDRRDDQGERGAAAPPSPPSPSRGEGEHH